MVSGVTGPNGANAMSPVEAELPLGRAPALCRSMVAQPATVPLLRCKAVTRSHVQVITPLPPIPTEPTGPEIEFLLRIYASYIIM